MQIIPVILCGGAGSRLWPVSRALHPKPFIRLMDGQSLLQKAFLRGSQLPGVHDLLTVTNQDLFFKINQEFEELGQSDVRMSYILEPFGRNTAGAIAVAARFVEKHYGAEALMLVLAADHLIQLHDAFQDAVARAVAIAQSVCLVTFGIQPDRPETGYGYIEVDMMSSFMLEDKAAAPAGYRVQRFVEKPQLAVAEAYIESGNHLWNAGMFCFQAGSLLQKMTLVCDELAQSAATCFERSHVAEGKAGNPSCLTLDVASYQTVADVSFDYAVLEPLSELQREQPEALIAVVPCQMGWSDIGSWGALGDLSDPDVNGNRVVGEVMLKDTVNCTIHSQERFVGAVGLSNLIIVDTVDALLVANRDSVQDVKHVYES